MTGGPRGQRKVAFETLGCKLNQYETDAIATALQQRGYRVIPFAPGADAYVINSCTVTNKADRKSRNTMYRALRVAEENAPVVVTGCFVDGHRTVDPGIRYWIRNEHKHSIPELLDAHFRGETADPASLKGDSFSFVTPARVFHTRTNLKVQDGCDNFCSFCIIPFVRGRARSRPPQDVLREAGEAIAAGSQELVLTGVNMSRYRAQERDFADLVEAILTLPGDFRLRISSLEPDGLDRRFVELFRHPRMCPHLHLCLQSGSERILLRMRRMYTLQSYRAIVEELRALDPFFHLTTDIITGFPGEQPADLDATLRAIREFHFGHVHQFPYSVRSGTRAARMENVVPFRETRRRVAAVQQTAAQEKRRYLRSLVGRDESVLLERVEQADEGTAAETVTATGLGRYYVPVLVQGLPTARARQNTMVPVRLIGLEERGDDPRLIGRYPP